MADVVPVIARARPKQPDRPATGIVPVGNAAGVYWRVTPQGVLLKFAGDRDAMAPLKQADPGKSMWGFTQFNGEWWARSRLPEGLRDALRNILTPAAMSVLDRLATAIPQVAQGPEGTFQALGAGYIKLYLNRPWKPRSPIAGIISTRVENPKGEAKRWFHLFKASRAALMVAPELRQAGFPVVAKQLHDATIKLAEPFDSTYAHCDPLRDMADAADPGAVKHPVGRAVLKDVMEAMRIGAPAKLALYAYQIVGVGFLKLLNYRGIIGDSPGLGKTAQALAAIITDAATLLPALVVAPASVFTNWQDETTMWVPQLPQWPMPSRSSEGPPPGFKGIIVTTFSLIPYQLEQIQKCGPKYMIVDEAHRIKNSDALQSQAVTGLAMEIPHVVLLTGTPLENNIGELWNLLQAVDTEDYGRKGEFVDEFAEVEEQHIGRGRTVKKIVGAKNTDVLKHRLKCLMIRRLKEDVAKDLPDLTRHYTRVEPDAAVMKEYSKAEKQFGDWVKEELGRRISQGLAAEGIDVDSVDVQSEIAREVRQRAEKTVAAEALARVTYLRQLVGRMKVPYAIDLISDFVENGEPVIVFGVHQEVVWGIAEGLKKAGIRFAVFDGNTSKEDKGRAVRDFQAGKIDAIIGSEAMREGVTLTRSHTVILVEHMWNTSREEQAESRAHRSGQKNAVLAIYPEIHGTIDMRIHSILEVKRALVKSIVGAADVETKDATTTSALLESFLDDAPVASKAKRRKNMGVPKKRGPQYKIQKSRVFAVVFDQKKWTPSQAQSWLRANGFGKQRLDRVRGRVVASISDGRDSEGRSAVVADGVSVVY